MPADTSASASSVRVRPISGRLFGHAGARGKRCAGRAGGEVEGQGHGQGSIWVDRVAVATFVAHITQRTLCVTKRPGLGGNQKMLALGAQHMAMSLQTALLWLAAANVAGVCGIRPRQEACPERLQAHLRKYASVAGACRRQHWRRWGPTVVSPQDAQGAVSLPVIRHRCASDCRNLSGLSGPICFPRCKAEGLDPYLQPAIESSAAEMPFSEKE